MLSRILHIAFNQIGTVLILKGLFFFLKAAFYIESKKSKGSPIKKTFSVVLNSCYRTVSSDILFLW